MLEGQARADLAQWLRHIGHDARRPGEEELPISLEIALAQGFKYAANRRSPHPDDGREVRMHLAEQALEMLKGSRFWFSQLTLIQALCLLNMSDSPRPASDKHGAKPEAIVQHWLDVAGRERPDRGQRAGMPGRAAPLRPRGGPARRPGAEDGPSPAVLLDRRERCRRPGGFP